MASIGQEFPPRFPEAYLKRSPNMCWQIWQFVLQINPVLAYLLSLFIDIFLLTSKVCLTPNPVYHFLLSVRSCPNLTKYLYFPCRYLTTNILHAFTSSSTQNDFQLYLLFCFSFEVKAFGGGRRWWVDTFKKVASSISQIWFNFFRIKSRNFGRKCRKRSMYYCANVEKDLRTCCAYVVNDLNP